jgi:hypothetical protein
MYQQVQLPRAAASAAAPAASRPCVLAATEPVALLPAHHPLPFARSLSTNQRA